MAFIHPNLSIIPVIIITDADEPQINDLNLQTDDLDKEYELECKVKFKKVIALLENNSTAKHQYILELQDISKFTEETN